jgi:hypothetical protein
MAPENTTRAGVEDELHEATLTRELVDWPTGDATADHPAHGARWDAQRTRRCCTAGPAPQAPRR